MQLAGYSNVLFRRVRRLGGTGRTRPGTGNSRHGGQIARMTLMAKNSSFVHLHNHTEFSMLDGMAKVDLLAEEVSRQEMPAVGMTDHGNMFGSDAFYRR